MNELAVDRPGAVEATGALCLPAAVTLTGTVSSVGTLLTGTGTKFLTELFVDPTVEVEFPFTTNSQGSWNASTNTPALVGSVGTEGYLYTVSVAGTTNVDGNFSWAVGDKIAFYQGRWRKASIYNRNIVPYYRYIYSAVLTEIMEIAEVRSDTTLILKTAFTANLSSETLRVPGRNPVYKSISLSTADTDALIGTIGNEAAALPDDVTTNYDQEGGLEPICIDGDINVVTQI